MDRVYFQKALRQAARQNKAAKIQFNHGSRRAGPIHTDKMALDFQCETVKTPRGLIVRKMGSERWTEQVSGSLGTRRAGLGKTA